ncbi:SSI family serine proteinase inhibitor [Streptomyces decoyicus]|uniref:SSI family serine proteinase inhibitor n=1 Tax=Streptomyces decoyicus TaxID=249567 RepID=UPI00362F79D8
MPHRRTSSLFSAAAGAATTAVTRLSATTAVAGRLSATTAAVSVVSVTAALALAAPAASAAPIPLPHHRSGNSIIGAGHRTPTGHPAAVGHPATVGHSALTGHPALTGNPAAVGHPTVAGLGATTALGAPTGPHSLTDPHALTAAHTLASPHALTGHGPAVGNGPGAGQGAPERDHAAVDHLTVTVRDSGSAATDGTFELYCHPGRGNHPHVKRACKKLDGMTMWGRDPFAPVPQGTNCTMMYGGPATAHVSGTWAGRPVNADFRRTNGCEISRWGRFEPLLPATSS